VNIDDLIATAQPRIEKVRICARGDLVAKHQDAVVAMAATVSDDDSLAGNPATVEAAEAVRAVEDEMEAATVEVTVATVSRNQWADLLGTHPPSKEQRRLGHAYDPETFAIAMVAACLVPPLTDEKAKELAGAIPFAEWQKLERAALMLNVSETPSPKLAAATELLQANGRSSTTSDPEGSLADGSSVSGDKQ
jgi:hypothetical protein